jgi:azurin
VQELVGSSSAYAPIKRLLDVLTFNPAKELVAEGCDDDNAAGDGSVKRRRRVSAHFWVVTDMEDITDVCSSGFNAKWKLTFKV